MDNEESDDEDDGQEKVVFIKGNKDLVLWLLYKMMMRMMNEKSCIY